MHDIVAPGLPRTTSCEWRGGGRRVHLHLPLQHRGVWGVERGGVGEADYDEDEGEGEADVMCEDE
jgi:hypothetical protein